MIMLDNLKSNCLERKIIFFTFTFIKYKKKYQQCHGVICFDININNNKQNGKDKQYY